MTISNFNVVSVSSLEKGDFFRHLTCDWEVVHICEDGVVCAVCEDGEDDIFFPQEKVLM